MRYQLGLFTETQPMRGSAAFSDCRRYRYKLERVWGDGPACLFVMLNPSTADERQDDPTIRRCLAFADRWGYRRLYVANLFAYRATNPKDMKVVADPVGPANDRWIRYLSRKAYLTITAWGTHGEFLDRAQAVMPLLTRPHWLRLTRAGHPCHPLYLPATLQPIAWGTQTEFAQ